MGARILVIDNVDSFVFNLVQQLGELGAEPVVVRNNAATVDDLVELDPDGVLISPGPGTPADAGVTNDAIRAFAGQRPILGVCLGHECIGEIYGATVVRAAELMHGKTSVIHHDGKGIFAGLPDPITATRYHSLVVDPGTVPAALEVTATTDDGVIMGLRHRRFDVESVQFHPESILTTSGQDLVANFLASCGSGSGGRTRR